MSLNNIFAGVFDTSLQTPISFTSFMLCLASSLVIGLMLAAMYTFKSRYSKSFVITLAILPAVVCVVIMMVNGNLGAGVAVAGTFSLVRFRSVPGTAKEIGAIFLAMSAGLAAGMGYIAYAALFTLLLSGINMLYNGIGFGGKSSKERALKITIPESLNYTEVFKDLFIKYTKEYELLSVKTTNMGSLFCLNYSLIMNNDAQEKALIDELRCRNGNLEICITQQISGVCEL